MSHAKLVAFYFIIEYGCMIEIIVNGNMTDMTRYKYSFYMHFIYGIFQNQLEYLVFLEFTRCDLFSGPDKRLYDLVLEQLFVTFIC